MGCGKEPEAAAIAHDDTGLYGDTRRLWPDFDDLIIGHDVPVAGSAGVPDRSLNELMTARSAASRTRAGRRRSMAAGKVSWRRDSASQEQDVIKHSPSIKEPTKTIRGALAVGDAVQAAHQIPAT